MTADLQQNEISEALHSFLLDFEQDDLLVIIDSIKRLPTLAACLDKQQITEHLLPFFEDILDKQYCHDEVLLNIAEQLEPLSTFIGGVQNANLLMPLFEKLFAIEDPNVREQSINSLKNISCKFGDIFVAEHMLNLVMKLSESEWFTSKSSATGLYSVVYPKLSEELKLDLRRMYQMLCQDDSPMVRKASATNLVEFLDVLESDVIANEFIPVFDNFAKDDQDNVRVISISVGMAMAKKLTPKEIEDHILTTFLNLGNDCSWRVRYQFADQINEIQLALGPKITREKLIDIFYLLARDVEPQVREVIAKRLTNFCSFLQDSYESESDPDDLDPIIVNRFIPLVKELDSDPWPEVKEELCTGLPNFAALLGRTLSKAHLLPLIHTKVESDSDKIKENLVTNLNSIIEVVGLEDMSDTILTILTDLMTKCNIVWRTKRNLIVTILCIANHSNREYFEERLIPLYVQLYNDGVFAVRRTAPLILPLLAKRFGPKWTKSFVKNHIFTLAESKKYLTRLLCLCSIKELIKPTMNISYKNEKHQYTVNLKYAFACEDENIKLKVAKILYTMKVKLENLNFDLNKDWVKHTLAVCPSEGYFNEDLKFYVGEALEELERDYRTEVLTVEYREIFEDGHNSYIECLISLLPEILKVIHYLRCDKIENVKLRAIECLSEIKNLVHDIYADINDDWVKEAIATIPKEDEIFNLIKIRTKSSLSMNEDKPHVEEKHQEDIITVKEEAEVEEATLKDDSEPNINSEKNAEIVEESLLMECSEELAVDSKCEEIILENILEESPHQCDVKQDDNSQICDLPKQENVVPAIEVTEDMPLSPGPTTEL